jgi:hypothetical protein
MNPETDRFIEPGEDPTPKEPHTMKTTQTGMMANSVVVKCHADGSWLSEFEPNGRAIFRLAKNERMILRADDPRLEPYFDAPYEVRDITVTPDAAPTPESDNKRNETRKDLRVSHTTPDYDSTFAPMLVINGHKYYLRDSIGTDAPMEVFEQLSAVNELLNKSEAMRDMLIVCSKFHHPKGTELLIGVIKSAYRTIVKFRPSLASNS